MRSPFTWFFLGCLPALAFPGCRLGYEPLDAELSSIGAGGNAGAPGDINSGGLVGSTTSAGGASGTSSGTTGIAGFVGYGGVSTGGGSDAGGATGTGGASATSTTGTGGVAGSGGAPGTGGSAGTGGVGGASSTSTTSSAGSSSSGGAGTGGSGIGGSGTGGSGTGGSGAGGSGAGGTGGSGAAGSGGTPGEPGVGEEPYCQRLHHLAGTPVIDGALDGNLPLQDLPKDAVRVPADNPPGFSSVPSDVSMRFAAAWFDGGFYLFVEAVDPNRYPARAADDEWMGDGIDIYVDHDAVFAAAPGFYDDPGTRSLAVAAPSDASAPSMRGSIYMPFVDLGVWGGNQFVAVPTADGYRIEAVVTAATLGLSSWSPSSVAPFAFDLGHNVSFPAGETGTEGRRLGHYFVRAAAGADGDFEDYPFYNSAVFCVPTLVAP